MKNRITNAILVRSEPSKLVEGKTRATQQINCEYADICSLYEIQDSPADQVDCQPAIEGSGSGGSDRIGNAGSRGL